MTPICSAHLSNSAGQRSVQCDMHTSSTPCLYQRNGGVVHPGQLRESGTLRLGAAERKAADGIQQKSIKGASCSCGASDNMCDSGSKTLGD
jgi:hypothetical protein